MRRSSLMGSNLVWSSEREFTLDGVSYLSVPFSQQASRTSPEQMVLLKPREEIEGYEAMVEEFAPHNILELGIFAGGSAALMAQLAKPHKLVAVDLRKSCPFLEQFIDASGLREVISPYYGVDQADGQRLDEIVAQEFGGEPLDLIIDDASHLLAETRASFNRLFPYLRPGGTYVIEDWTWAHTHFPGDDPELQGVPPLSAFVCELALAAACRPAVIAEVRLDAFKAVVRRGTRELTPGVFDLAHHFDSVSQDMMDRLAPVRTPVRTSPPSNGETS